MSSCTVAIWIILCRFLNPSDLLLFSLNTVKLTGFVVKDFGFPPKPSFDAVCVQSNKTYSENLRLS